MQTLTHGYQGLSLLINLNWDRMLYIATVLAALWLGSFLGSVGLN